MKATSVHMTMLQAPGQSPEETSCPFGSFVSLKCCLQRRVVAVSLSDLHMDQLNCSFVDDFTAQLGEKMMLLKLQWSCWMGWHSYLEAQPRL